MKEETACEWNPKQSRAAFVGDDDGACQRPAAVRVGKVEAFLLCESCAALPVFARRKSRRPLREVPR